MFAIGIIIFIAVASVGSMVWADRRKLRKLHARPRTKIGELVGGNRVRVIGIARKIADDVGATYSGTLCLACKSWVFSSGDGERPADVVRIVPFRVEDKTGSIEIAIDHVTLRLAGHIIDLARTKAVFGAGMIARESSSLAGGRVTFWEDRLEPDARVAVIGIVVSSDDGTPRLAGRTEEPLVIANVEEAFLD